MRKLVGWLGGLAALGLVGFLVVTDPAFHRVLFGIGLPLPAAPPDLANGRAMFFAGGCASCHATPGHADRLRLGGGLALHSPFGTFHAPNLSPHPADGIGGWTLDQFIRAMREGVAPDGRHYYPAFPYASYQRMGAKDLADLFAFLKSLAPVAGRAPEHALAFPFQIRRLVGGWKLLYLDGRVFVPDPGRSAAWNRGAYLVEGPGHCAECHSPRDALGGIVQARRYAGGPDPENPRKTVPNITPHRDGIGDWSKGDHAQFLKTGESPAFVTAGGSMASVIRNMAELSDDDRAAMAEFLVTLPPIAGKPQPAR
ncbi:MAG: cytochrome c [Hyphomicrobiales bacterium]|nr:cytochrome c [Hyphomicrobiales bacterium]MCA1998704.1 cytochrome c [Hyphomicrobiales bacterium]